VIDPYQSRCLEVALFLKTSANETFARVVKNIKDVVDMIIKVEPSVVSTRTGHGEPRARNSWYPASAKEIKIERMIPLSLFSGLKVAIRQAIGFASVIRIAERWYA